MTTKECESGDYLTSGEPLYSSKAATKPRDSLKDRPFVCPRQTTDQGTVSTAKPAEQRITRVSGRMRITRVARGTLAALGVGLALLAGLNLETGSLPDADEQTRPEPVSAAPLSRMYLPLAVAPFPDLSEPAPFGTEERLSDPDPSGGLRYMAAAGTRWVRWNAALWAELEPTEGTRNWAAASSLEARLRETTAGGMRAILIIRGTPDWAQTAGRGYCGPVRADKLSAFASFVRDLVTRYSHPPYNVKHWELWNEPDVDFSPGAPGLDQEFGCWGDRQDPYYGGGYYAQMLKAVYPEIKAADPDAQVLVGGLLLGCDPAHTGADSSCTGLDGNLPSKFLEGILRSGANFDGVSFHGYDFYQRPPYPSCSFGAPCRYANPAWSSDSNTGPVAFAKARFIKDLLARYSMADKYLMNTEAAVLCDGADCGDDYEATKAYYIAQMFAMAQAPEGLRVSSWYGVFGWRGSDLLSPDLTHRPAYTAYQVAAKALTGARFTREVDTYPGVKVYEFERGNRQVWVLWSLGEMERTVILPIRPMAGYDVLGNNVLGNVGSATATVVASPKPLYLEWSR